jgi:hypothetical protein
VQPYLQIPWSIALGDGWALNGMDTNFFTPASDNKFTYQSTLVIEKEFGERSFCSWNISAIFRPSAAATS